MAEMVQDAVLMNDRRKLFSVDSCTHLRPCTSPLQKKNPEIVVSAKLAIFPAIPTRAIFHLLTDVSE